MSKAPIIILLTH